MDLGGINPNSFNPLNKGASTSAELEPLVKLIATRLGVSDFTAFRVLRKFMAGANASTFSEISSFVNKFLGDTTNQRQVNELAKDLQNLQNNPEAKEQNFKPVIERLQYGLVQARQNIQVQQASAQQINAQDRFVAATQAKTVNPSTELVQSPKNFASWLVNNKAAFILLKSNPDLSSLVLALQNPQIQKSPALFSQLVALISQILKLKSGKSLTEDIDETKKEEFEKEEMTNYLDKQSARVSDLKETVGVNKVSHLKDFLLEAERFAEEEIANLWSLTLKKEKELERKLKKEFGKFKQNKQDENE